MQSSHESDTGEQGPSPPDQPPGRDETTVKSTRPRLSVATKVRSSSRCSSTKSAGPRVIRVVTAGPNGSASSQGAAAQPATGEQSSTVAASAARMRIHQPCIFPSRLLAEISQLRRSRP